MGDFRFFRKSPPFVRFLWLGVPIIFILASPTHFVYDWTKQNSIIGLVAPVNESIWEHLKLAFWPMLLWFLAGFLLYGRRTKSEWSKYILSCAAAEITCTLFIIAFFYSYTGAFGIESLALDILSLLLALLVSILLATHIYTYAKPNFAAVLLAAALLILMGGAFLYFTGNPPHIPLFVDSSEG